MNDFLTHYIYRFLCSISGKQCTALLGKLIQLHGIEKLAGAMGLSPDIFKVRPGYFYSPYPDIPSVQARSERIFGKLPNGALGVNEQINKQLSLAAELEPLLRDFPYSLSADESEVTGAYLGRPLRYRCHKGNTTFQLDAVILQAMLRHFTPNRIIEVGSGYSSAIMLDIRELQGWSHQELTFIEPYAQDYFFPLLRTEDRESIILIEQPLWEVDRHYFESLESGDLLFIDSSHVAKIGSDVYDYMFDILPRLKSGVLIHIHDVTPNYEASPDWFQRGWHWNEGAFLRAFLMYNDAFEVLFHSSLLYQEHSDSLGIQTIKEHAANTFRRPEWHWTNSFYLRRK